MTPSIKGRRSAIKEQGRPHGIALMAVVVTLVILALMMSAIAWQMLANRRMLDHREYELQAAWLARAGIERAAARLLGSPDTFVEENVDLLESSCVRVEVKREAASSNVFRISSEASYPTDVRDVVARSVVRRFERQIDGDRVRLVSLPGGE